MKILAVVLFLGFICFVWDLLASGPQSKYEREANMRNGRIQK